MFLNTWSVALSLLSILVLFLMAFACRTAINVLRFWNPASDSNRQIRLENETWLAAALVQNALALQIASVILFALTADKFSAVINGAMCATGSLLANDYGMPTLYVKLLGVFLYGFWIVLHKLDISRENYPFLRIKFIYLLLLLPFIIADITLQTTYIYNLHPNIITSCCAVVYSEGQGGGMNLTGSIPHNILLVLFYSTAFLLYILGAVRAQNFWRLVSGALWLFFLWISLVAITALFSSYIYAMPYHHCPFCILKPQYHYIGFLIYASLFPAAFFGISGPLLNLFRGAELRNLSRGYQRLATKISLVFMTIFLITVSYHYIIYNFMGGETG
jgi:hypothetical protein